MKVLIPVCYCIRTFRLPSQWLHTNDTSVYTLCECQKLESDVVYLAFATQFPTIPIITMGDLGSCMFTCFSVQNVVVLMWSPVHPPSITTKNCWNISELRTMRKKSP